VTCPLYPTEAQIARAVLGNRSKGLAAYCQLEDKEGLPRINEFGPFWPAVVAFFHGWHSISNDGK
jgi:hypothetical protein